MLPPALGIRIYRLEKVKFKGEISIVFITHSWYCFYLTKMSVILERVYLKKVLSNTTQVFEELISLYSRRGHCVIFLHSSPFLHISALKGLFTNFEYIPFFSCPNKRNIFRERSISIEQLWLEIIEKNGAQSQSVLYI